MFLLQPPTVPESNAHSEAPQQQPPPQLSAAVISTPGTINLVLRIRNLADAEPLNKHVDARHSVCVDVVSASVFMVTPYLNNSSQTGHLLGNHHDRHRVFVILRAKHVSITHIKNTLHLISIGSGDRRDTPDGIASELVGAGLVDGKDVVVVAANLQKLIDNQIMRTTTFALKQTPEEAAVDTPDDKALIGFAQLSIVD
ncbi:hypothetical protein HPB51_023017 [Rhipicephalus microplus]|uniref:non-specific serine/threonine protein kinase n=1 Tax=Rhipicephalus microplus TaxID=6941 RepID=A0A9J6D7A3_RHIMP|nr:hypothetical protein HPB51_023017 [Rhipicephalus microplus]